MQNAKEFADALNKNLEELGVPANIRERAVILGKMFDIPKQQAWSLLEGHLFPDESLFQKMATEFDF